MFQEMKDFFLQNAIRNIIVACPNCYKVFKKYGDEISVTTAYTFMEENGLPETAKINGVVTVHDPCAVRSEESVHRAVRNLIAQKGLIIDGMKHSGIKTICCGEGGLSDAWPLNWQEIGGPK